MPSTPNAPRLPQPLLEEIAGYIHRHFEYPCASECTIAAPRRLRSISEQSHEKSIAPAADCLSGSLENILQKLDAGFTETLLHLIDESGQTDATIYKRAGLSKQHFSKIRNDDHYRPTKSTAIALALALELDIKQTQDLISRAGFTLSNSSKFDLIIRYFIEHRNFNIVEINLALYEFDQPLLGG